MKVTIEIDATPKEMRTLMGLPDIEPLQQEWMEKIRDKTMVAIDTNDPMSLMKMFMPSADQFKSMESLQKSFWDAMMRGMDLSGRTKDSD